MVGKGPLKPVAAEQNPSEWAKIAPYAILSLAGFACALLLLSLFVWKADTLVHLGLTGNLYYIILVPLGLAASAFLFGVLRSWGYYRGKLFGGVVELGGPAVTFFMILILGFQLPAPASNFGLTVYVHGPGGVHDLVLRGYGKVLLDTGAVRLNAAIDPSGQAVFPEISASFRGQDAPIGLDADGYEVAETSAKVRLGVSATYLSVRRKSGHLTVRTQDESGNAVAHARILVAGRQEYTDPDGRLEMTIPGEMVNQELALQATAPGYQDWSSAVWADSNPVVVVFRRR